MPVEIPWGLEPDDFDTVGASSQLSFLPLYIDDASGFVVIDEEDYVWASQWRGWGWNPSKNRKKLYVRRTSRYGGRFVSVYLHKAICLRAHGMPPSASHIIADHKDGNTLNCRRENLRWATPSENRQNYNGVYALQTRLDLKTGGARLLRSHKFGGLHGHDPVAPAAAQGAGHPPSRRELNDAPF